jgi:stress response protein SCP2
MQTLSHGERIALAILGLGNPVALRAEVVILGAEVDIVLLGLDAQGHLSDDRYMLFDNQPASPCGAARLVCNNTAGTSFEVDLARLPAEIDQLVLCAAVDGGRTLGEGQGACVSLGDRATYTVDHAVLQGLRAVKLISLYRKDGAWRVAAIGQGFNGGLEALVEHFGGTVTAPRTPPPTKVSLEKKVAEKAPHLVSLAKSAAVVLEKRGLLDTVCRVGLVLDASGSMTAQYARGGVQAVVERVLPLAVQFDDDGALDCWTFATRPLALPPATLDNIRGYVDTQSGGYRRWMDGRIGYANNEPAVLKDVIEMYRDTTLPVYIIFVSDGGVGANRQIEKILRDAANLPIFWQFVGIGGSNYGVLERLDTLSGRRVDNCGFFALDDLNDVGDGELYDRLLSELPTWLKAARAAGVLR